MQVILGLIVDSSQTLLQPMFPMDRLRRAMFFLPVWIPGTMGLTIAMVNLTMIQMKMALTLRGFHRRTVLSAIATTWIPDTPWCRRAIARWWIKIAMGFGAAPTLTEAAMDRRTAVRL